ncbi:Trans-2,3-dihydro-3-hydroxyanthranilate isomerase [Stieleria neptunia]|uniref:Trans-2,3-dihydro-3-hydroxyanthranilate isomerase n=1 Tax=Stieleria neptunia TaxID=2527979 RepID=A0A518HJ48_9BACT|nr:PhzF family phenazine biosynthesis protein [Stieleria neptunia]QDV40820.1 Trans-2,3-dihydro-3-hydroxyanthranilate isomerase [Stieleria neptunia]
MPPNDGVPIWQVDAFATRPFSGNPAAICLLESPRDSEWMQQVAVEMNLSETAFVVPTGRPNKFHLRWFTPAVEVDLCGHATLGAAHTLIEQKRVDPSRPILFQTRSGCLSCQCEGPSITMDFPVTPPSGAVDPATIADLQDALGVAVNHVAKSNEDVFAVVESEQTLRSVCPDFGRLAKIETRGVIITAASSTAGVDFVSRFFAPRFGINEDPVTGSAHCCLAPYWSQRLGRSSLTGYQASRRGGLVHTQVIGDRVQLSGQAVTMMEARFLIDASDDHR